MTNDESGRFRQRRNGRNTLKFAAFRILSHSLKMKEEIYWKVNLKLWQDSRQKSRVRLNSEVSTELKPWVEGDLRVWELFVYFLQNHRKDSDKIVR